MRTGLTYDDVCLVPRYSNVPSRTIPDLSSWLTTDVKVEIPLIAANMDTVIDEELAEILIANGSMPIFHRFATIEKQVEWAKKYQAFGSCGIEDFDGAMKILDAGAKGICIDIAHGHCQNMINFIRDIKQKRPDKQIIAGNVCTSRAFHDLAVAGADSVKCGVGPGAACTTRIQTGFGTPQFTAVQKCAKVARDLRVPLIADGGIKHPKDVCIALAAGASTVMVGSLFAKTVESAAPKIERDGKTYCLYRGQASAHFQKDYFGKVKKGTVPEGIHFETECSGTAQELIDTYCGALRSSMTYGGAKDIKEFQRKAKFMAVTTNYSIESHPRPK